MNFNIESILEKFESRTRLVVLVVLVVATVTGIIAVPITKSFIDRDSEHRNCFECLDENKNLTHRIVEISKLFREYQILVTIENIETQEYATAQPEAAMEISTESDSQNDTIQAFENEIHETAQIAEPIRAKEIPYPMGKDQSIAKRKMEMLKEINDKLTTSKPTN